MGCLRRISVRRQGINYNDDEDDVSVITVNDYCRINYKLVFLPLRWSSMHEPMWASYCFQVRRSTDRRTAQRLSRGTFDAIRPECSTAKCDFSKYLTQPQSRSVEPPHPLLVHLESQLSTNALLIITKQTPIASFKLRLFSQKDRGTDFSRPFFMILEVCREIYSCHDGNIAQSAETVLV